MRVVVCEPGEYARIADIEYAPRPFDFEVVEFADGAIREIVGDTLAALLSRCLPWDDNVALIYNDRFLLDGSMPNREVGGTLICGTFLICGFEGYDYASLTEEQAKRYCKELYSPRIFIPTDRVVFSYPCTPTEYQKFYTEGLNRGFRHNDLN